MTDDSEQPSDDGREPEENGPRGVPDQGATQPAEPEPDPDAKAANDGHDADSHTVVHDFEGERPASGAVTTALASALDVDVTDVPPLHESVDLEALDGLFLDASGDRRETDVSVRFVHESHRVSVHGIGRVVVEPSSSDPLTDEGAVADTPSPKPPSDDDESDEEV